MALSLQAVRLAKLALCIPVLPRAKPIVSFSKIDRDRHELNMMAERTNGAIGYPCNPFRLGALRYHPPAFRKQNKHLPSSRVDPA